MIVARQRAVQEKVLLCAPMQLRLYPIAPILSFLQFQPVKRHHWQRLQTIQQQCLLMRRGDVFDVQDGA
jgi:hypothetical protein